MSLLPTLTPSHQKSFLDFFKNFLGQEKAVTTPMEFLNLFSNIKNLSFTHCVETSNDELEKIKNLGATVNHCVTSNRILKLHRNYSTYNSLRLSNTMQAIVFFCQRQWLTID